MRIDNFADQQVATESATRWAAGHFCRAMLGLLILSRSLREDAVCDAI
jgi:hypothetical protein